MDIARMLTWTADRYPGRKAVGGPEPLTYRQWDARTNQLARALAGLGVRPGDRVALLLPGGEPMASLHLAVQKLGAASVPLSVRFGGLAAEDDDGDPWVSGRVDDMINSGGENIYPDEIEDALARCPAVSAVVVVGLPDDRWGQAVTVFAVPAREFSPERAVAHLAGYARDGSGLAAIKRPKRYVAVDRIPTSAVGKILRRELTEGRYHPLAEVQT
jgi:acyl-CoA synthetase (AMP-forming)/AMP-acid ligase II